MLSQIQLGLFYKNVHFADGKLWVQCFFKKGDKRCDQILNKNISTHHFMLCVNPRKEHWWDISKSSSFTLYIVTDEKTAIFVFSDHHFYWYTYCIYLKFRSTLKKKKELSVCSQMCLNFLKKIWKIKPINFVKLNFTRLTLILQETFYF